MVGDPFVFGVGEMGDSTAAIKQHLPPHLIVLIDSLNNIEFHKLTKKILRERLEEIKVAIAKELAKKSTAANGDTRDQPVVRPNSYANSSEPASNCDIGRQRQKVVEKPLEKVKSLAAQNSKPSTASSSKSSALGLSKNGPTPPSFNDLLRLAETKGDHRQTPDRYLSQRSLSPHKPEPAVRTSNHTASRAHSPPPQNRPRPRASDPYPARANNPPSRTNGTFKSNGISKSARYDDDNIRTSSSTKNGNSSQRRDVQSREESRIAHKKDVRRATDEDMPENSKKEPVKSARARKRDEEQRLEEIKRRRIEEENERVRLRNEILAGRRSKIDKNDLKTFVTKSQGSTVLSCGRSSGDSTVAPRPQYQNAPPRPKDPRGNMEREKLRERRLPGPNAIDPGAGRRMHRNPYMDDDYYSRPPLDPRSRRYNEYDDEDEDEDEDMDDFIDDDVQENESADVSRTIREVFGYDKRRYADFDDDDIEEASYAQIQKEERRSERLGKLEDAQDMRLEAEHKKRKRERMMGRR